VKLTWTGTDDPSCVNPGTVVQRPGQCGNAVFIAVPGDGQPSAGPTDLTSAPQLAALYGSVRTTALLKRVGLRVVDPPSAPLGTLTGGLAGVRGTSAADYTAQARQTLGAALPAYVAGAGARLADLRQTVAAVRDECAAGTPVVLAGFAQGAMAVHDYLAGLAAGTDTAAQRAVLGAVLIADPERVANSAVPEFAGALPRSSGVCAFAGAAGACTPTPADVPRTFQAVTSSLCAEYDPVCETSHLVEQLAQNFADPAARTTQLANATRAHASYSTALSTGVVGNVIGLRITLR
jgi:hypothetical protein